MFKWSTTRIVDIYNLTDEHMKNWCRLHSHYIHGNLKAVAFKMGFCVTLKQYKERSLSLV